MSSVSLSEQSQEVRGSAKLAPEFDSVTLEHNELPLKEKESVLYNLYQGCQCPKYFYVFLRLVLLGKFFNFFELC